MFGGEDLLMRKWFIRFLCVGFAAVTTLICIISAHPVNADSNSSNTVTISPTLITSSINSGSSYTYPVTVSNSYALTLEVAGLGQTTDGSTENLDTAQDTGPYSARTWVSIDQTQLAVGTSQIVHITVTVPSSAQPGEYYAGVYMYGAGSSQGSATIIPGVIVPIILTVNSSSFTPNVAGAITALTVPQSYAGQALDVLTTLSNTGNCLLTGTEDEVTISNSSGTVVWQNQAPVSAPSIIPGYPRIIDTQDNVGLSVGNYSVESEVTLTNGGTVDSKTISFTVTTPPPIPTAPELTSPGNSTTPGPITTTLTPTFEWGSVTAAADYTLTVSRTPYSTNSLVYTSDELTGTSFTLPTGVLFDGQSYCWEVTATNVSGTSPASSIFYFQTPGSYSPPTIATDAASNITSTGAILNGNLTGLGSSSSANVNFAYGTSTSYGYTTSVQTLSASVAFQAVITGLTPNTTYHFQANAGGVSIIYGNDVTFTTLAATTTTSTSTTTMSASTTTTTTPTSSTTTPTSTTITYTSIAVATTTTSAPSTAVFANIGQYLLPGIDPSSLAGISFNGVATPYLDATQQAGTEITLNGISGNGSIIVGKYISEPSGDVPFSDGTMKGGTYETPIQFIFLMTQGYDHGTAQIVGHFTSNEISGFDPNSLFLAYYNGSQWVACENNEVSPGNSTITGDIPVSQLTAGTVIGLGGNQIGSANVVPFVPQSNNGTTNHGVSWSLVGIVVGLILVVGGVVWVIERNRRKSTAD
jgi:hypothetical protein